MFTEKTQKAEDMESLCGTSAMRPEIAIVIENGKVKAVYSDPEAGVYVNIINLDDPDPDAYEEAQRTLDVMEKKGAVLSYKAPDTSEAECKNLADSAEFPFGVPAAEPAKAGEDIVLSDKTVAVEGEILPSSGGAINVYLGIYFDAEKKFPDYAEAAAEGDAWMDLYADYKPCDGSLHVFGNVVLTTFADGHSTDDERKFDYTPTAEEAENIKEMIAKAISDAYGQTPIEFLADCVKEGA